MYFHKNQCKSGLDMLEFKILTNFDLKDRELTAGDDHYSLYLTHNEGKFTCRILCDTIM